MFCSNCGKEITADQRFCSSCGAENRNYESTDIVSSSPNSVQKVEQTNTIFNREVLKNYLNNLQTLEFAKHKLEENCRNIEYKINSLQHKNYGVRSRDNQGSLWGAFIIMGGGALIAMWLNGLLGGALGILLVPAAVICGIISVIALVCAVAGCAQESSRYENETIRNQEQQKIDEEEKAYLLSILPVAQQDLERTEALLQEAYSINIIPAKYRNIYAAYFLYEYISTSTVSLSDALYHCDLDEISRKLDVIIEQQQEIIMELARSNALNEQIIRQNEQTLKHAIAAENNTALAAQYSQISAVNSKTVAQIQSYYFFKGGL